MIRNKLIALGEALIDFIPNEKGCEFYEVTEFSPKVGGAPANVCCAYSVLGGRSGIITQLGNDPFGASILRELKSYGVDTGEIALTDKANTALAFVSLGKDGNRTFSFYRKPSADMLYSAEQLNRDYFSDAYVFHFCSVDLGDFPMKEAHRRAIEYAKESGVMVSFDPNLRFQLWQDIDLLKSTVNEFIGYADILKISDEELEFITGEKDINKALDILFRGDVKLVIYTCGAGGAYVFTKKISVYSEAPKAKVVDTTGAGDGFMGSFLYKLNQSGVTVNNISETDKATLQSCADFSTAFCAISVTRHGAMSSYPTMDELN
ncbi:MAG: carbohydrate kinase [Clostridiales bacterium]|nr:carbohydrate kinase [Clostridiales bacterium]